MQCLSRFRQLAVFAGKAASRKFAVLYYNVMTKGIDYVEKGVADYQQKIKEQRLKYLQKQPKQPGFNLSPMTA